jgi:hypothetical protein
MFWEPNVDFFQVYIEFRQTYGHINRQKIYEAMLHFDIPVKTIRLVRRAVTNNVRQKMVQTK